MTLAGLARHIGNVALILAVFADALDTIDGELER